MNLQLNPCPWCGGKEVKVLQCLADNKCRAVFCLACGARGPARYKADYMSEDRVQFLASHDWNLRYSLAIAGSIESTKEPLSDDEIRDLVSTSFNMGHNFASGRSLCAKQQAWMEETFQKILDGIGPPNTPRETPLVDHREIGDQDAGGASMAGEAGTRLVSPDVHPDGNPGPDDSDPGVDQPQVSPSPAGPAHASAENLSPEPPAPPVSPISSPPPLGELITLPALRRRLQAFFKRTGKGLYTVDLGITPQNIKRILNGKTKKLRPESASKVIAALDELESDPLSTSRSYRDKFIHRSPRPDDHQPAGAPDTSNAAVECLPNKLAPITGMNPLPDLKPPSRCSRVP